MIWIKETSKGYKYDRRFFWAGMIAIIVAFLNIAYQYEFNFHNKMYFVCNDFGGCENPYFNMECDRAWLYGDKCLIECREEWCKEEVLPTGVYGEKPPENFGRNFVIQIIVILLIAFILNHFFHNRGKVPHFEFLLTEKQKKFIKKLKAPRLED